MKYLICQGDKVVNQRVEEEIRADDDIVLVPVDALVCQTCGERYYDRTTVRRLEALVEQLRRREHTTGPVGQVLRLVA